MDSDINDALDYMVQAVSAQYLDAPGVVFRMPTTIPLLESMMQYGVYNGLRTCITR